MDSRFRGNDVPRGSLENQPPRPLRIHPLCRAILTLHLDAINRVSTANGKAVVKNWLSCQFFSLEGNIIVNHFNPLNHYSYNYATTCGAICNSLS